MRFGGAIDGFRLTCNSLQSAFAALATPNGEEIAPRTGSGGKVTPLPFRSFNPDPKRVTHCREKVHISCEYSIFKSDK